MNGSPLIRRLAINVITTDRDAGKETVIFKDSKAQNCMHEENNPKVNPQFRKLDDSPLLAPPFGFEL